MSTEPSIPCRYWEMRSVYGLFRASEWLYFGESENIQQRLLDHLGGDNPYLLTMGPTHFSFEA